MLKNALTWVSLSFALLISVLAAANPILNIPIGKQTVQANDAGASVATAANQAVGNASLSSIDTKLSGPVPVSAVGTTPVQQVAIPTTPNNYLQQDLIPSGAYSGKTEFHTDAKSAAVNNTRVDVIEFGTSYVPPASAIQMQLVSTSANDAALGSGVRTVKIYYLDANYSPQTTTVTLNGVTPVLTTPTNIIRVNEMHAATTASASASAAGNISLQAVGGATTYSYIAAGYKTARSSFYTLPAGKTGYISSWGMAAGAATGSHLTTCTLSATSFNGESFPSVFLLQHEVSQLNNAIEFAFPLPLRIAPQSDIKVECVSDASNANVSVTASYEGWYE